MKLTYTVINRAGDPIASNEMVFTPKPDSSFAIDAARLELGEYGARFAFIYYIPEFGKLTFLLRRKAAVTSGPFDGDNIEFDAFVDLKRFPAAFHCRLANGTFIKIALEQEVNLTSQP